jgi:hypothetical protein
VAVGEQALSSPISTKARGCQKRGAQVLKVYAEYEPFALWLTRERIGQDLRERYAVPQEVPPRLLADQVDCSKNDYSITSGPWLTRDHQDAELTSIMSCIKLRRASVSKGLRNIGKLGGTACAASL